MKSTTPFLKTLVFEHNTPLGMSDPARGLLWHMANPDWRIDSRFADFISNASLLKTTRASPATGGDSTPIASDDGLAERTGGEVWRHYDGNHRQLLSNLLD